jgi:hypothetical protein
MAIEAPISKHKKNNLKLYAVFCVVFAIIFGYDGYLSKYEWSKRRSFYDENVIDGKPNETMIFNRYAPIALILGAALLAFRYQTVKNRKLVADENELVFSDGTKIPYGAIEKIDKTHFKKKGIFVITYKDSSGRKIDRRISDRNYDGLEAVLELLVSKLS